MQFTDNTNKTAYGRFTFLTLKFEIMKSIMKISTLVKILILFFGVSVFAQTGKVVWVKDGDTFILKEDNGKKHTIRVADIDAPETSKDEGVPGQPFSKKALRFTINEIYGKVVQVKIKNYDDYGRTIGYVKYENKDLGNELLKAGLAWHYKYYSDDAYMAKLEKDAKDNKIGLWIDPNPINPYKWRKGQRN